MKTISPWMLVAAEDLYCACVAAVQANSHAIDCAKHHDAPCDCWLRLAKAALSKVSNVHPRDTEAP